jgi:hypothetical protein
MAMVKQPGRTSQQTDMAAGGQVHAPPVPLFVYGALVGTLHVASKFGELLFPTLAPSRPLLLLSLNANDTIMLVTSTSTPLLPYLLVCDASRLLWLTALLSLWWQPPGLPMTARSRARFAYHGLRWTKRTTTT